MSGGGNHQQVEVLEEDGEIGRAVVGECGNQFTLVRDRLRGRTWGVEAVVRPAGDRIAKYTSDWLDAMNGTDMGIIWKYRSIRITIADLSDRDFP